MSASALLPALLCLAAAAAQPGALRVNYTVQENKSNYTIGNVAGDLDLHLLFNAQQARNLQFRFLTQPDPYMTFKITSSGLLRTGPGPLDRDQACAHRVTCLVTWKIAVGPVDAMKVIRVTVEVKDVNDVTPQFPQRRVSLRVLENARPGLSLSLPSATDTDAPRHGIRRYELRDQHGKIVTRPFGVRWDGSSLSLQVTGPLDRERRAGYNLRVAAIDGSGQTGELVVYITIVDVNDHQPTFSQQRYEVSVAESTRVGKTIVHVQAEDKDSGPYGKLTYGLDSRTQLSAGAISLLTRLDYEVQQKYELGVTAKDQDPNSFPTKAKVIVKVLDENDHKPEVTVSYTAGSPAQAPGGTLEAAVPENVASGRAFVAHLIVTDRDAGKNGETSCSLKDDTFVMELTDVNEYQVFTRRVLDRETLAQYNLAIVCTDKGTPQQTSVRNLRVRVVDVNDHTPRFRNRVYGSQIIENNFVGASIVQVAADDADEGPNAEITYSLDPDAKGLFAINSKSGLITANSRFDREKLENIVFHVRATDNADGAGGSIRKTASAEVIVAVKDVNDNAPRFTQSEYRFGVFENQEVGTEIEEVKASDPDTALYNKFSYRWSDSSLQDANPYFVLNSITGMISTRVKLDREQQEQYSLHVEAVDTGVPPRTGTAKVIIQVADDNDNAPIVSWPTASNDTARVTSYVPRGYVFARIRAKDADTLKNGQLIYIIETGNEDGWFDLDPSTGALSIDRDLSELDATKDHVYLLRYRVKDGGYPPHNVEGEFRVVINKTATVPRGAFSGIVALVGQNVTIVVALCCVSGVVIVVLILAIACIRRQSQDKRTHRYNCRKSEELSMLRANAARNASLDTAADSPNVSRDTGAYSNGGVNISSASANHNSHNNVYHVTETAPRVHMMTQRMNGRDGVFDSSTEKLTCKSLQSWPSSQLTSFQSPQATSSWLTTTAATPPETSYVQGYVQHSAQGSRPSCLQNGISKHDLEVHQLLQQLRKEQADADSAYSGESSQPDSGRGPSEEGADSRPNSNCDRPPAAATSPGGPPRALGLPKPPVCPPAPAPPAPHDVPSPPTDSMDSSVTSDASDVTVIDTSVIAPRPEPHWPEHGHRGVERVPIHVYDNSAKVRHIPSSPRPARFTSFQGNGHRQADKSQGYHSNSDTPDARPVRTEYRCADVSGESGVLTEYSCADMTSASPALNFSTTKQVTSHRGIASECSDSIADDNTTTSGSYVVDPEDLCREIDDLFFRDMVV